MSHISLVALSLPTGAIHAAWIVLWLVLLLGSVAALTGLLVTRWGRNCPMRICVILSLIAHLLLFGYAATIRIAGTAIGLEGEVVEVALGDAFMGTIDPARPDKPWEQFPGRAGEIPPLEVPRMDEAEIPETDYVPAPPEPSPVAGPLVPARLQTAAPVAAVAPEMQRPTAAPPTRPRPLAESGPERIAEKLPESLPLEAAEELPVADHPPLAATLRPAPSPIAAPLELADAKNEKQNEASPQDDRPKLVKIERPPAGEGTQPPRTPGGHQLPELYRLRSADDRARQAGRFGGSPEAEEAVEAGLAWLAAAQEEDGSWDPVRWHGGRDRPASDHHRRRAGTKAKTGISALALLAFLGSGHTHMSPGPYQSGVRKGLEYLAAHQKKNGSLAGESTIFAAMYCHGMASFALSEAYGMTGDARLRPYVDRAITFTLQSQNRQTGGWRYRPSDTGDTSQLGWQVMAIKSAELAGVPITEKAKQGVTRFLSYVSSGQRGGLASYRPGKPPTAAMTAEALFCRLFTGTRPLDPVANEAAEFLLANPPRPVYSADERMNLYAWYYATLALYQRQDALWEQWNQALQTTLLATQQQSGQLKGSWSADTEWGPHGGRVYSTAMATLCLEVYYRFLPIDGGATAKMKQTSPTR